MSKNEHEKKQQQQTTEGSTIIDEGAAAKAYTQQAEKDAESEQPATPNEIKKAEKKEAKSKQNKLEEELQMQKDKLLRLHAEFDNFRKRNERERSLLVRRANGDLLEAIIPVLDHFLLALNHDSDASTFHDGVKMIYKQLDEVLGKFGLERIKALGAQFDPEFHEALMSESSSEHEEGTILQIMQEGYMLNGSVLRPARVKVSSEAE